MKKIAVVHDLSGLGKCSLTAAIPVISAMGVQACPLPTAILSNQTGYDSYFCDDYTDRIPAITAEWKKRSFVPDGIYTGFLAGEDQVDCILDFVEQFAGPDTKVIVDPVMGDDGVSYKFYTEALCEKLGRLVAKAQVITPNLTEGMLLLQGRKAMEAMWAQALNSSAGGLQTADLRQAAEAVGAALLEQYPGLEAAVITGVHFPGDDGLPQIGNLIAERSGLSWVSTPKRGGSYSGTGDLFTSVISAGAVKGQSLVSVAQRAVRFLERAIADAAAEETDRNDGVCFERYLNMLWEEEK